MGVLLFGYRVLVIQEREVAKWGIKHAKNLFSIAGVRTTATSIVVAGRKLWITTIANVQTAD